MIKQMTKMVSKDKKRAGNRMIALMKAVTHKMKASTRMEARLTAPMEMDKLTNYLNQPTVESRQILLIKTNARARR